MIDSTPAANATGISAIEPGELPVEPALELRIEGWAAVGVRHCLVAARPAPAPDEHRDHRRGGQEADRRQEPDDPVEALLRRRRQHRRPELRDQLVLDLLLRCALRDALPDQALDPAGGRCVRLVKRRLAGRTDQLALQVGRVRTGCGSGHQDESRGERQHEPHAPSTSSTQSSNRSLLPSRWTPASTRSHTSLPERATKNVSGTPVNPYWVVVFPGPS